LSNIPYVRLPIIIIDALDESGSLDRSSIKACRDILSHIVEWFKLLPHFKLIITSRIEDDIKHVFSNIHHQSFIISTSDTVSSKFREISDNHPNLPIDWPGDDVVDDLTRRALGIFIWMVTALSYVESYPSNERLNIVKDGTLPFRDVHALYYQVLTRSFSGYSSYECAKVIDLVGTVVITQLSLTTKEFGLFLNIGTIVDNIYDGLLFVLADEETLQFIHQSFVDFMLGNINQSANDSIDDELSCFEDFCIDLTNAHCFITESMFRLMNKRLQFNICNIESLFVTNAVLSQS
ncbi:hypothetical protein OBBRIDRAFT_740046, partial [Obba rivulosa]